jgi:hypothetical protein
MPPVAKAGGQQFRKDIAFVTKDDEDDEQVAAGIVMVPDKADLQNDFAREDTIRSFADQFEAFVAAGEAGGGIMHAVFPGDWMALERNEVLDEAEEIGGETVEAGAWVQEWAINHDDLWELILEDVISGYSIGAIQVGWNGPFAQDELDDVEVPDELGDELVWELVEGIIREVSAVDIPAVPDAQILDTKAAAEKRLGDYLGDPNGFVEEAMERGHSEDEAEFLWDVLTEAAEEDGAGDPGEKSVFQRIGKAAVDAFLGDPDPDVDEFDAAGDTGSTAPDTGSADRSSPTDPDANDTSGAQADKDDAGGDTPDDDGGSKSADPDMGDNTNDDVGGDDKSLAEKNAEQISELTESVNTLTEAITGPELKTAEIEIDGETYEVREDAARAALGVSEDDDVGEAIERLNKKAGRVDDLERRVDNIARQSGGSGQVEAAANGENGDDSRLDELGKALS